MVKNKNMFEPGTKLWYYTKGIPKPLECDYVESIEETGSPESLHTVCFCQQTKLLVCGSELFKTKEDAEGTQPEKHQYSIDIVKLLLEAIAASKKEE